jgi:signal transduction histidine kinase
VNPAVEMARVPARPTRLDVGVVAVLLAWSLLELFALGSVDAAAVLFVLAVTVPLLLRRRFPVPVLAVCAGAIVWRAFTATGGDNGAQPFPSLLVVTFSLALHVRTWWISAPLGVVPAVLMLLLIGTGYFGDQLAAAPVVMLSFFVGGAWLAGRLVRRAADRAEAEQARAQVLAHEAVTEERARIARELHDVVAHAVSIVVVQAGAAESLIEKDPAAAREHLAAVRRTGREALTEMRHLLEVLREGEATYDPQPTLDRIGELVTDTRRAGTPGELTVNGAVVELPAGVELCAYRVVQEALTNIRKHAPGARTRVCVGYLRDRLELAVHNDLSPGRTERLPGAGHGIPGMTERVRLYGGTLVAGARDGGFTVQACIPLEAS